MSDISELKEWTEIFLRSRDAIQKSIVSIEHLNGDFVVHKSSGDVLFLIRPEFQNIDEVVEKCGSASGLVVLNTKKNVDALISGWDKLSKLKGLCVYFVNPKLNEKWLIYPYTHDQITERSALKIGLHSLFSMVPSC